MPTQSVDEPITATGSHHEQQPERTFYTARSHFLPHHLLSASSFIVASPGIILKRGRLPLVSSHQSAPALSAILKSCIRNPKFLKKLVKAEDLITLFKSGDHIGMSGFTGVGGSKAVPVECMDVRLIEGHRGLSPLRPTFIELIETLKQ
ncbi:hypothetical protein V1527DRAFT_455040 [Lipomyces starkeyi]